MVDRLAVRGIGFGQPARRNDDKAPAAQSAAQREHAHRGDDREAEEQEPFDHAVTLRLLSAASAAAMPVS